MAGASGAPRRRQALPTRDRPHPAGQPGPTLGRLREAGVGAPRRRPTPFRRRGESPASHTRAPRRRSSSARGLACGPGATRRRQAHPARPDDGWRIRRAPTTAGASDKGPPASCGPTRTDVGQASRSGRRCASTPSDAVSPARRESGVTHARLDVGRVRHAGSRAFPARPDDGRRIRRDLTRTRRRDSTTAGASDKGPPASCGPTRTDVGQASRSGRRCASTSSDAVPPARRKSGVSHARLDVGRVRHAGSRAFPARPDDRRSLAARPDAGSRLRPDDGWRFRRGTARILRAEPERRWVGFAQRASARRDVASSMPMEKKIDKNRRGRCGRGRKQP
jgi:hypothetical protein